MTARTVSTFCSHLGDLVNKERTALGGLFVQLRGDWRQDSFS
jgi:hypothetical protein